MLQGTITNQGMTLNTQLCDNDHNITNMQTHVKEPTYITGSNHQPGHNIKHQALWQWPW